MRARPPRRQHVEQLLVDLVAGVVRGAGPNQLDGAGMRRPAHRQAVHLPQLAIGAQQ